MNSGGRYTSRNLRKGSRRARVVALVAVLAPKCQGFHGERPSAIASRADRQALSGSSRARRRHRQAGPGLPSLAVPSLAEEERVTPGVDDGAGSLAALLDDAALHHDLVPVPEDGERLQVLTAAAMEEQQRDHQKEPSVLLPSELQSPVDVVLAEAATVCERHGLVAHKEITYREIVAFCVPLMVMGLTSPILSLVDSGVVGRCVGASSLAALAPATSICDRLSLLLSCLGATTTSFVARAATRGLDEDVDRTLSNSVFYAVVVGSLCWAGLATYGAAILTALMGGSTALLPEALTYTLWRAAGFPAALCLQALQATYLGLKDWRVPTMAAGLACILNLVGDLVLVNHFHMGVAGPAAATVASQLGAALFLAAKWRRRQRPASQEDAALITAQNPPVLRREDRLGWWSRLRRWVPTRQEHGDWFKFGMPLCLAQTARVMNLMIITSAVTCCGAVSCAAHQVVSSFTELTCSPTGDSLSVTAQAYFPGIVEQQEKRRFAMRLAGVGAACGLFCAALALVPAVAPVLLRGFTTDAAIAGAILSLLLPAAFITALYTPATALEGILISESSPTVVRLYAAAPFITAASILTFRNALGATPMAAWAAYSVYQIARTASFGAGVKGLLWGSTSPTVAPNAEDAPQQPPLPRPRRYLRPLRRQSALPTPSPQSQSTSDVADHAAHLATVPA